MPDHKLRWSYLDVVKQKHLVIAQAANVATKVPEDKLLEAELSHEQFPVGSLRVELQGRSGNTRASCRHKSDVGGSTLLQVLEDKDNWVNVFRKC